MTQIHLISSETEEFPENTRSSFTNRIDFAGVGEFSAISLKDLYFKAEFTNINRQSHPHIVFIVKDNSGLKKFSHTISDGEGGKKEEEEEGEEICTSFYIEGVSGQSTSFAFGISKEYDIDNRRVVELTFNPIIMRSIDHAISILNKVLIRSEIHEKIKFSKHDESGILYYRTIDSEVYFDTSLATLLGFEIEKGGLVLRNQLPNFLALLMPYDPLSGVYRRESIGGHVVLPVGTSSGPPHKYTQFHEHQIGHLGQTLKKINTYVQCNADSVFSADLNKPKNVFIVCELVDHQIYNNSLMRILGVISLTDQRSHLKNFKNYSNEETLIHFTPIENFIAKVGSCDRTSIRIRLVDENCQALKLSIGPPTIVSIQLLEMSNTIERLIFVSSNDLINMKFYPDNSASSFGVKLPQEISFEDRVVHIDLVGISLPTRIHNITESFNKIKVIHTPNAVDNSVPTSIHVPVLPQCCIEETDHQDEDMNVEHYVSIEPGYYTSLEEIQRRNKDRFLKYCIYTEIVHDRLFLSNTSTDIDSTIHMSGSLACVLGLEAASRALTEYSISLGGRTILGKHPPQLELMYPGYIMLYTDFVENSIMGGKQCPILKVLPAPGYHLPSKTNSVHYDFNSTANVRMCKGVVRQLSFQLRDITGNLVLFDSKAPCELLLKMSYDS